MFMKSLILMLRRMMRRKGFSLINIAGLAVGLAACILVLLWVQDELSFDRFHANADRIYRIIEEDMDEAQKGMMYAVTPIPLAPTLVEELPEVTHATRFSRTSVRFRLGSESRIDNGAWVDPDFLSMFSFEMLGGDMKTALTEPYSVVLSEQMAHIHFEDENPVGKSLFTMRGTDFIVTGVMKNVPSNSHMQFDFLLSFQLLESLGRSLDRWDDVSWHTYFMVDRGTNMRIVEEKIGECIRTHKSDGSESIYHAQPIGDVHLRSDFKFDFAGTGDIRYVYIFTIAASFILLIACINFMNLTTARSADRAKEVGLRKVVGAGRGELIRGFLVESIIYAITAAVLAVLIVEAGLPAFNELTGKQLHMDYFRDWRTAYALAALALMTGLAAGSYPAIFLSATRPSEMIKGFRNIAGGGKAFRRILVITQFTLSVVLIIATTVVYKQIDYMRSAKLGFDKEQILFFRMIGGISNHLDSVKQKLLAHSDILSVSATNSLPIFEGNGTGGAEWEGKNPDESVQMRFDAVDVDYLETFRMELADGRFFSAEFPADSSEAFVVNEAAVAAMGIDSPVGKAFAWDDRSGMIIGVVKNFQLRSLRNDIDPMFLMLHPDFFRYLCLRLDSSDPASAIAHIEQVWKTFSPGYPFSYYFLDEAFDDLYRSEQRVGKIAALAAILAVFISCLGLFGLAAFMAEQRNKEIGVRKVLGASVSGIVAQLLRDFTRWVLVANAIAWPIAFLIMREWLKGFACRVEIGLSTFLIAGALSITLAILTVSFQTVRTARMNPVDTLRNE